MFSCYNYYINGDHTQTGIRLSNNLTQVCLFTLLQVWWSTSAASRASRCRCCGLNVQLPSEPPFIHNQKQPETAGGVTPLLSVAHQTGAKDKTHVLRTSPRTHATCHTVFMH